VNPELIELVVEDVQPYDVVGEGRFVISLHFYNHFNFAKPGDLRPDYGPAVQIDTAVVVGVNEPTGLAPPAMPYFVRPHQSDIDSIVYRVGTMVRVVRGMSPPIESCPFDDDGDGNCAYHTDCATRELRRE